jgi:hypothetical protein
VALGTGLAGAASASITFQIIYGSGLMSYVKIISLLIVLAVFCQQTLKFPGN